MTKVDKKILTKTSTIVDMVKKEQRNCYTGVAVYLAICGERPHCPIFIPRNIHKFDFSSSNELLPRLLSVFECKM